MYLMQVLASLRRRWLLTSLAAMLGALTFYAMASVVGPSYTSESSLVLVPPPTTSRTVNADGTSTEGNPYMYLGGLTEARDVLVKSMSSETVHKQVSDKVGSGTYEVTPDWDTRAPMLVIVTKAATSSDGEALTAAVLDQVPTVLAQIQEDLSIRSDARITTRVVTADPVIPNHKAQMRMLALATLAMLAVLALLIAAIDGLLLRREARMRKTRPPVSPAPDRVEPPVEVPVREPVEDSALDPVPEPVQEPAAEPVGHDPAGGRQSPNGRKRSRKQRRPPARAPQPAVPVKGAGVAARSGVARAAS